MQKDEFVLEPNHFVLASTAESIRVTHDMAAYVEGRSSIGRLGLQVQNAGFIDAGFHAQITLELENQSGFPIVLKKGVRICQIVFVQMSRSAEQPVQRKVLWTKRSHSKSSGSGSGIYISLFLSGRST